MKNMNIPVEKNNRWIEGLYRSIDQLSEEAKAFVMKQAGESCAPDILTLSEAYLGCKINTIQDLVKGWNLLRDSRNLKGGWELKGDEIHGFFYECGCPLVRSGLIKPHPVHCLCSKGMIETVFAKVSPKEVQAIIKCSIGNGDDLCEFIVNIR